MKKCRNFLKEISLTAVIFIMIVSLTACINIQDKADVTTTQLITTTKPTTTKAITITKAETTKATTAKATTVTTKPTTTKPTTQKITTTQKETTTEKPVLTEYDILLSKLKKELEKKSFEEEVDLLFLDTFEMLYQNYPTWQHGYRNFPSREEYISTRLIDIIQTITKIDFYKNDSDEANRLLDEGLPIGYFTIDKNGGNVIFIISEPYDTENEVLRQDSVESFFHEITHCHQRRHISENFNGHFYLYYILSEGGATFHMKFTQPSSLEHRGSWLIEKENSEYIIEYSKHNCNGYLLDMNAYEKLVYLLGYDTVEKVIANQISFSEVQNMLSEKYGEEETIKFFQTLQDWYTEYENAWKSDVTYDLALSLENQFLDFIKQDIELLKTKEEAEKYKTIYEFYIKKNLPQVKMIQKTGTNSESYVNLTSETFDIETLDKMLEEKIPSNPSSPSEKTNFEKGVENPTVSDNQQ